MTRLQPFDLKPYTDVIYRHGLAAVCTLLLGLVTTSAFALLLPNLFRSSELLVVQQPEITSADIRSSTGGGGSGGDRSEPIMEGLEKLSQEAYTDSHLAEMIREMGLYGRPASSSSAGNLVGYMRKHIRLTVPERTFDYENYQRKKEERGANLLEVSFEYTNPKVAQQVTERITDLLLATSLAERVKSAAQAREFLGESVAQAQEKLVEKEKDLEHLKLRFAGGLPEQLAENVNELSRLEEELHGVDEQLASQEVAEQTNSESSPKAKLQALQLQLDSLRAQYSEKYPDVIELEREIAETKQELANPGSLSSTITHDGNGALIESVDLYGARLSKLQNQAQTLRTEIVSVRERIAETPAHEQQLAELRREYDLLETEYEHLRDRELEARLNEELIRRREGQRLQVIEPADFPTNPVESKRVAILEIGLLMTLSFALGIPFALYFFDTSFKEPAELKDAFGLPILGVIPSMPGSGPSTGQLAGRAIALTSVGCFLSVAAVWTYTKLLF
jgi:succinoglycan biosynthesis transport protein ExoP